jgi:penicillin-binding protein 2
VTSRTFGQPADLRNAYRFGAFALAVVVGMTTLGARMFYLQLLQGQPEAQSANATATAVQSIPSTRGLIYDANGNVLAQNIVSYSVMVTPSDLPLDEEPVVAQRLGALLNVNPVDIETAIDAATGSMYTPVKIADNVAVSVARFIEENTDQLPGVKVVSASHRQYPAGPLYGEVVGYLGQITARQYANLSAKGYSATDILGQNGLEAYYESRLRGTYGSETVALDSAGKPIPGLVTPKTAPVPGDSLTLTINTREQTLAQTALAWGLNGAGIRSGVIIVENPQNGNILAMVSLPSYNDQLFADGISETDFQALLTDPAQPLLNKAVAAQYAPGSTFKIITATAGLEVQPSCDSAPGITGDNEYHYCSGNFSISTKLLTQPYIQIGAFKYWDWNKTGFGPLDVYDGIAHSSDTFFYQVSRMLGIDNLSYWADQYGFGKSTGIDLPFEATGIVPTDAWKQSNQGLPIYTGEVMLAGIGQGFDAGSPLQLLNAYSALANGGNLWRPHVVGSTTDATGKVTQVQPVLLNKLQASAQTLQAIRIGTRKVITSRHTYNMVDLPISVAGKTGTAEFGEVDRYGRLPYHEWFVGYVNADPYSDDFSGTSSNLAVVAFLNGADTWGNVATEVVKYYLMLHFGIVKNQAIATNHNTPGYVLSWVLKRTNFYGTGNRD